MMNPNYDDFEGEDEAMRGYMAVQAQVTDIADRKSSLLSVDSNAKGIQRMSPYTDVVGVALVTHLQTAQENLSIDRGCIPVRFVTAGFVITYPETLHLLVMRITTLFVTCEDGNRLHLGRHAFTERLPPAGIAPPAGPAAHARHAP